ncbi:MAG TPA: TIGR04133 family radical SAM/SPASM protein [Bacteroidales bacterium]|nr:TIGR04133 family radical SAM/SPASM protein [Bacteroidales bacterium]
MTVSKISIRKRIALNLFQKYKDNESKVHQLNYILWECTLRCNLKCLHCGSDCKKDASIKDMPARDFFKAIDDITAIVNPHNTMIVLTGGEALLRKDLEQIGQSLYKRGFPWGIVSNGMLLNRDKLNSLLNSGLRAVTVSLDGLEESHNWLRGNSKSYTSSLNAISLLPAIPDIKYDVVTCVNQKNFSELNQIKELLIHLGVKEWRIFTIFPIGRAKQHKELQLDPEKFKKLFDFILQSRKEGKIKLNYGCEGFLGNYEREVRDNFFICRAGINIASILADGSISACPNLRENFIQGNIYKDNFKEVWENKYSIFRDKRWTKTGICSDCDFYKYCEGNGMHLRDENSGALLFCHLKRIVEGEKIVSA